MHHLPKVVKKDMQTTFFQRGFLISTLHSVSLYELSVHISISNFLVFSFLNKKLALDPHLHIPFTIFTCISCIQLLELAAGIF